MRPTFFSLRRGGVCLCPRIVSVTLPFIVPVATQQKRYASSSTTPTPPPPLSPPSAASSLADEMRARGFENPTPNFSGDVFGSSAGAAETPPLDVPTDLVTVNAEGVDVGRDLYGPWLVMTDDLQGELFIDHDAFAFYRPANGLGYGIGRLEVLDAKKAGTAFTLKLETYTYEQTTSFAPRHGVVLEVTGMVKRVSSASTQYETFSLIGIFRKDDRNVSYVKGERTGAAEGLSDEDALITGQFNAAKLSPWTPTEKDAPWQPNKDLQQVFKEVFPSTLTLTSHLRRRDAQLEKLTEKATANGLPRGAKTGQPLHVDLEQFRVGSVPDVFYIPNYVSTDEEAQILSLVKRTPQELKSKIPKRTVQEWGCTMCSECEKSFVSDANMPPWVQACTDMLTFDGIFTPSTFPNSVRVHEYECGEGIGPHCDGPIYVPGVTVLSLGSTSAMSFYPRRDPYLDQPMEHYNDTFKFSDGAIGAQTPLMTVVLEPRSLLVFSGTAYYYHPHGLSDKAVDDLSLSMAGEVVNRHLLEHKDVMSVQRGYRVSLTTRNLLTRCSHQPARAEYNMKRTWYLYNQLPVPEPLFTFPAGTNGTPTHAASREGEEATAAFSDGPSRCGAEDRDGLTRSQLSTWERRMDRIFKEQEEIKRSLHELKELLTLSAAAEMQFRKDTSSILNNLTTTVLDLDAKLEDIQDSVEDVDKKD